MGFFDFLGGGNAPEATATSIPVTPPGAMGEQLNGLDPSVQIPPPQTPEELNQRKSQWGVFLDRVKSDPNIQLAMLRLGTNMMQPVPPGQTGAGHLGRSLDDSVSYLGGLREAERARTMAERELALKERKGAADIAQTGAQTASTLQTTDQSSQLFPDKLKTLQLELKKLQSEEGTWTPEQAKKALDLKNAILQEQINTAKTTQEMNRAHAGMFNAVAGKGDSARKVQSQKFDDGTIVTVTNDKNGTYYSRFVPPKFNSVEDAKKAAESVVAKKTAWWGKNDYEGTREQEIARLVALWTKPQIEHYDQAMKPLKELPPEPMDVTPVPKASPSEKALTGTVAMDPGTHVDSNEQVAVLRNLLDETDKQLAFATPGSPKYLGLVDAKKELTAKLQASAMYGTNALVQGPSGLAVEKPSTSTATPAATPAPAAKANQRVVVQTDENGKPVLPKSTTGVSSVGKDFYILEREARAIDADIARVTERFNSPQATAPGEKKRLQAELVDLAQKRKEVEDQMKPLRGK